MANKTKIEILTDVELALMAQFDNARSKAKSDGERARLVELELQIREDVAYCLRVKKSEAQ